MDCRALTFEEFINNILVNYPGGYLNRLYRMYTDECGIIGKQETLLADLTNIMGKFGHDISGIINHDYFSNKSDSEKLEYAPGHAEKIIEIESEVFEEYNYPREEI